MLPSSSVNRARLIFVSLSVLASVSGCHSVGFRFTGQDVSDPEGYLIIRGEREESRILVSSLKYRCSIILPYAEDWVVTSGLFHEIRAGSVQNGFWARVDIVSCERTPDPEAYLRNEVLKEARTRLDGDAKRAIIRNATIERIGGNPVLEYQEDLYGRRRFLANERPFLHQSLIVWGIRVAKGGLVYLIRLATKILDEPQVSEIRAVMRDIAGEKFAITD